MGAKKLLGHLRSQPIAAAAWQVFDPKHRALVELRDTAALVEDFSAKNFRGMTRGELRDSAVAMRAALARDGGFDVVEGFALIREAARISIRLGGASDSPDGNGTWEPRLVQLMGAIAGFPGSVVEMKPGEGKTLVVAMNAAANVIAGLPVHSMTANDYLAARDAGWMGPLFNQLGLSSAVLFPRGQSLQPRPDAYVFDPGYYDPRPADWRMRHLRPVYRREAYDVDIAYARCVTIAHDYLNDNLTFDESQKVQRGLFSAVGDEFDGLGLDEARTPMVISGALVPAPDVTEAAKAKFVEWAGRVRNLGPEHMDIDWEHRLVYITSAGEKKLGIPHLTDGGNLVDQRHLELALKAKVFYNLGEEFIERDGEIIIVDKPTGRLQEARQWRDGLHQAIEAKQGVPVHPEQPTIDGISVQNFLHLYQKVSGYTGTALEAANEFQGAYRLETNRIPTHMPSERVNLRDRVYATHKQKLVAILGEIVHVRNTGRPTLVVTTSVNRCNEISEALGRAGVENSPLHAEGAANETQVVALAGLQKAVTVATNIAGRGTDILLGGDPKYLADLLIAKGGLTDKADIASALQQTTDRCATDHDEIDALGGLHVICAEKNLSSRVDHQARGRAARGDEHGSSRIFLSLEDDLFIRYREEAEQFLPFANAQGLIEHPGIFEFVERVQREIEDRDVEVRRYLVDYEWSINRQRGIIYEEREKIRTAADTRANVLRYLNKSITNSIQAFCQGSQEQWDLKRLRKDIRRYAPVIADPKLVDWSRKETAEQMGHRLYDMASKYYCRRAPLTGSDEGWRLSERFMMLKIIQDRWEQHQAEMDHLREDMERWAYAGLKPWDQHTNKAKEMFDALEDSIEVEIVATVFRKQAESLAESGIADHEESAHVSDPDSDALTVV